MHCVGAAFAPTCTEAQQRQHQEQGERALLTHGCGMCSLLKELVSEPSFLAQLVTNANRRLTL